MADVIGSCSTLPGARHALPDGAMCDDHPTEPAVARVQGETDSMGAELHDLCQACVDQLGSRYSAGTCDWCRAQALDLRARRDFEEGMAGPVYQVCGACVLLDNQELQAELDEYGDDYWDGE